MSEEEKNEDGFAKMFEAMAKFQKAMARQIQPFLEQINKQPVIDKQLISKLLESTQPISEGMKKLVDSMQPFIDQSREMAEILKRLNGWLDKNN